MPVYGDWIQAPDYDAEGALQNPSGVNDKGWAHSLHTGGSTHDPLATSAEAQSLQVSANADVNPTAYTSDVGSGQDEGWPSSSGQMKYATNYVGGVFPPWETHMLAKWWFNLRGVSRYTYAVGNWYPGVLGTPPGAIGWQWQDDLTTGTAKVSDAVACTANLGLTGGGLDNSVTPTAAISPFKQDFWSTAAAFTTSEGYLPNVFYEDWITSWAGVSGAIDLLASVEAGEQGNYLAIDMTNALDSNGQAAFFTKMDFDTYSPLVPADLTQDGSGIGYGYAFGGNTVDWTFRPPVFRWIYEGEAPIPARLYPTDHKLRNNARIFPPSKSRHGGIKPTGYL